MVDNHKCQACGSKQTLVHLLVECQYVNTFWKSFASWRYSCNAPRVTLMATNKIYAHHPEKFSFHTLNFCLILAHFYIYTASKENEPLSILASKIPQKSKLTTELSVCPGVHVPLVNSFFFIVFVVYC